MCNHYKELIDKIFKDHHNTLQLLSNIARGREIYTIDSIDYDLYTVLEAKCYVVMLKILI